jgi:hypothetical protein
MPNWVDNSVVIVGPRVSLDRFAAQAGEGSRGCLSFLNFIKPLDTEMDWYNDRGWYDWNIEHWGTKWDADSASFEDNPGTLNYWFNTAWAPPEPVFREMARQYPELSFAIRCEEEQGWGFEYIAENGELIETKSWDIPETHAEKIERSGFCYCEGEPEFRPFSDCPKEKEEVTV